MIVAWYIRVVIGQIVHYKEVDFFDMMMLMNMIKVEKVKEQEFVIILIK